MATPESSGAGTERGAPAEPAAPTSDASTQRGLGIPRHIIDLRDETPLDLHAVRRLLDQAVDRLIGVEAQIADAVQHSADADARSAELLAAVRDLERSLRVLAGNDDARQELREALERFRARLEEPPGPA